MVYFVEHPPPSIHIAIHSVSRDRYLSVSIGTYEINITAARRSNRCQFFTHHAMV